MVLKSPITLQLPCTCAKFLNEMRVIAAVELATEQRDATDGKDDKYPKKQYQYVQDGKRNLQETFLCVRNAVGELGVPAEGEGGANLDGLDYLVGRSLDDINWKAYEGTKNAHISGGVPCSSIEIDRLDAEKVGALLYMFEKAVGISGRLLGVNPFDQPGVETYKKEMFRLLGKP